MKKYLLILFICLFLPLLSFAQSNIEVGQKSPTITIADWIQNSAEDRTLSHNHIILEFWATWCGPCIDIVPKMNSFHDRSYLSNFKESSHIGKLQIV